MRLAAALLHVPLPVALMVPLIVASCDRERPPAQPPAPGAAPAGSAAATPPLQKPKPGDRAAAQPHFVQGMQLYQRGDRPAALAALDRALTADPAFVEARMLRAQARADEGPSLDLDAALADLLLVKLERADAPMVIGMEGLVRFHLGQGEQARPLLEHAVSGPVAPGTEGTRASLLDALATLELRAGKADSAERRLDLARRLAPEQATICYSLSLVAAERGDASAQERWLAEAIRLDPQMLAARHARALLFARLGRKEEAAREKEIHECLRPFRDDTSLDFQQDHAGRAAKWGRYCELVPDDVGAQMSWVRELALAGKLAEATAAATSCAARKGAPAQWQGVLRELERQTRASGAGR